MGTKISRRPYICRKWTKLTLDSPYQSNSHIFYYRFLAYEPHVPFEHRILFENNDLLVVDKPHF